MSSCENRKNNILVVTSALDYGGAESVIFNLCNKLEKSIFNVTVCHLKEGGIIGDKIAEHGIEITGIKRKGGLRKYLTFLCLLELIKRKNIDLIHTHTTYALIDSALCKIFKRKLKLVHTFHFGNYPHYNKKYIILEKIFCRIPDKLVTVGYRQKKQIESIYPIKQNRTEVIWNGVDHEINIDKELESRYKNVNKVLIGTICLFTRQKGLEYLLEVVKELKSRQNNFILLLVGDGPLKDKIAKMREDYGLNDAVHFLGLYDNAAESILPIFDIFVQSSLWEAMSMAILEAMARAKPIVATDVGDNKQVTGNGSFIVEPQDVEGMVSSLEKLINSKSLRAKLGNAAYKEYRSCCSIDRMVKHYEKLYLDLL